jgi:hypothetical protein
MNDRLQGQENEPADRSTSSAPERGASSGAFEDLLHRLAPRQLVDELVRTAALLRTSSGCSSAVSGALGPRTPSAAAVRRSADRRRRPAGAALRAGYRSRRRPDPMVPAAGDGARDTRRVAAQDRASAATRHRSAGSDPGRPAPRARRRCRRGASRWPRRWPIAPRHRPSGSRDRVSPKRRNPGNSAARVSGHVVRGRRCPTHAGTPGSRRISAPSLGRPTGRGRDFSTLSLCSLGAPTRLLLDAFT